MLKDYTAHDKDGNVVTGNIAINSSSDITANGATVNIPAGYYESASNKSVATATQAIPSISVDAAGLITASSTQNAGYVEGGTKSATKQLTVQEAKTVTPTTSEQIAVESGMYTTSAVKVAAIPSKYVDTSNDNVTAATLVEGYTAHDATGAQITGTNPYAKAATDAAVEDIATAITNKGVTVPDGTTLDGMAALIDGIETGSGIDLNGCTWKFISAASEAGVASSLWSIGDCKAITLNGTVGTLTLSSYTTYVYILGFDHNGATNTIDFGTFKTALSGGTDICLIDSKCGSSSTDGTKYFNMNHSSNTNSGGWKGCDLRYDVLGSTNLDGGNAGTATATSPVSGTLMAALPSDLRAVMKPMTIYTDNTGGGSDTASYVTATVDYLPLLAEFEIFGKRTYANSAEKNYQAQYAYYSAGNIKVKYRHSATSSTVAWWERSPYYAVSYYFCFLSTNGSASSFHARNAYGLAPIFRV